MNQNTIIGLGSVVVDYQMFLERYPGENQKEHAASCRRQIGGPVPTALALLSNFGYQCKLLSTWGDDLAGSEIEEDLMKRGILFAKNCRSVLRQTGTAHVWITSSNGNRTIVAHQANWTDFELLAADQQTLRQCPLLHLDGTGGRIASQAAEIVKHHGGRVTVDAGSPKQATAALIPLADVFSFPERFAKQFFGNADVMQAGKRLLNQGAGIAVCTRGELGAIVFVGDRILSVSAFDVQTIDSTGAGDVFCGGLIAGLLRDCPIDHAVRIGAAAAAHKCQHIGNRSALPNRDFFEQVLRGDWPNAEKPI